MRWTLPALTLAVLAAFLICQGEANADDAPPLLQSQALSDAPPLFRGQVQTDVQLSPRSQPPGIELPRQDMPARTAEQGASDFISLPASPTVPPLLSDPVVRLAQRNEPLFVYNEPIGTHVDYNPYTQGSSPSRRFQLAATDLSRLVPGACSTVDPRASEYANLTNGELAVSAMDYDGPPPAPSMDEQLWLDSTFHTAGMIVIDHGVFRSAYQQPLAPLQPLQPVQPPSLAPTEPTAPSGELGALGAVSIAELAAAVGGSPVQGVGQAQAAAIAPTDLGALLQSANSVQSVNTTRRSPVALAPNIRGYEFNEIYSQANGAYWFPVREDLDSMLSKVDPGMIQDVVVIPGPYGLRYGPGLSFIDIVMSDTPRYDDGPGSDYRANGDIRTNGGQLYGRITAEGGDSDYGYRISYGHRVGDDYTAGNGEKIPSSYDSGDVWAQYGFNVNPYQKVEFSFLRLDQNLTNYAAQFFDVNTLETMGTTLRATDEDPMSPWTKAVYEGWWNRTQFTGSITDSKRDPNFPVIQRVEFALNQEIGGNNTVNGDTLGDNTSSGARAVFLFGELDDRYLRMGTDFHFLQNGLQENYDVTNSDPNVTPLGQFSTNLPFASMQDEGLFAEYGFPVTDGWDVAIGGRVDWVNTNVEFSQVRADTNLDLNALDQNNILYSYYLTNEFKLNTDWKVNVGYGYAQIPPSLTERYADGMFLGLLQSGFTRVIGNDQLLPERDFQIDAGISCTYDNFRASLTGFNAWIVDYDTFEGDQVVDFADARLVRYINTPLATLVGFESSADWDWSRTFTPFAKAKYVQGTDQGIHAPLPSIPPLEGTVGCRWHDCDKQKWEFEVGERMVTAQNRLGEILIVDVPTVVEERTPGFATTYLRGYYNWSKDMKLVAGIDNVLNRSYQEHLDLRLLGPAGFPAPPTRVLSPGFTPFFGFDWKF